MSRSRKPVYTISISKNAVNQLPLGRYRGPVRLVAADKDVPAAVEDLRRERILGFDTETRPSFRKGQNYPAALLQLAGEKEVYLFQLLKLNELKPLWAILADPGITKSGIAIHDDVKKLQERLDFKDAGFVELSKVTQKSGIVNTGLRSMSALFLKMRVSKSAQVTNWSADELTEAQIRYAATDAWISRLLYIHLMEGYNAFGANGKAPRLRF